MENESRENRTISEQILDHGIVSFTNQEAHYEHYKPGQPVPPGSDHLGETVLCLVVNGDQMNSSYNYLNVSKTYFL